ncbi:MAG: RNA polymerase-binding protein DksA, partial [Campylobacterota bacterium]|nr:RNA polymerase-binding protein DksA [Campylobacterota bacterium]
MQKSELEFFKKTLEERKLQILKNIEGVHNELNQLGSCELNDEGDHAANNNSTIVESTIGEQQREELRAIEVALVKIATGEYGTCAMCGVDIGFARLKVKPHAIYCID